MRLCIYVNLSHYKTVEFVVRRAYVQLNTTPAEDALANAMDTAILALAKQLAGGNSPNLQITSQDRNGLSTTYHEAGTLTMDGNGSANIGDRR